MPTDNDRYYRAAEQMVEIYGDGAPVIASNWLYSSKRNKDSKSVEMWTILLSAISETLGKSS